MLFRSILPAIDSVLGMVRWGRLHHLSQNPSWVTACASLFIRMTSLLFITRFVYYTSSVRIQTLINEVPLHLSASKSNVGGAYSSLQPVAQFEAGICCS